LRLRKVLTQCCCLRTGFGATFVVTASLQLFGAFGFELQFFEVKSELTLRRPFLYHDALAVPVKKAKAAVAPQGDLTRPLIPNSTVSDQASPLARENQEQSTVSRV